MHAPHLIGLCCVIVLASCDPTGPDLKRPARLVQLRGNEQVAEIGERVILSLRLLDSRGVRVADAAVLWAIESGAGVVESRSGRTWRDGVATAVLSVALGETRVSARIEGSDLRTVFTAHGCSRCGEWETVPVDLGTDGRAWASAASLDGRIWVIGGEGRIGSTQALHVFDPASVTWHPVDPSYGSVSAPVAAAVGGRIYLIGGYDPQAYTWRGTTGVGFFDPTTAQWTPVTGLAVGRFSAAGAIVDGKIFVVGGYAECDFDLGCISPLTSLEIYDPVTDRWTDGPSMNFARANAGAAVLDGKLYVVGGNGGTLYSPDEGLESAEMFDPLTNRWSHKADLPDAGPAQLAVMDGTLYAIVTIRAMQSSRMYEYDAARDQWIRLRDPPVMLYGAAVAVIDGGLYAIGGYSVATNRPFVRQISDAVYVMRRRPAPIQMTESGEP